MFLLSLWNWVVDTRNEVAERVHVALSRAEDDDSYDSGADMARIWPTSKAIAWLNEVTPWGGLTAVAVRGEALRLLSGPTLYDYGGPSAETIKTGNIAAACKEGGDCSGILLTVAVALGLCTPEWAIAHRSTAVMIPALVDVPAGEQQPGDVACYDGHVALVLTDAIDGPGDGQSYCLSMSGGGQSTHSDNPDACAKIVEGNYRKDFIGYKRFP